MCLFLRTHSKQYVFLILFGVCISFTGLKVLLFKTRLLVPGVWFVLTVRDNYITVV